MARSLRAAAAVLAACAVLPVVFALVVAWADLEVPGSYSVYGCSGTQAVTEYRAQYMTRVVESADSACYPLFLFWDSPDESSKPGISNIRLGQPLLLTGVGLALAAVAVLAIGDATRFLGAGVALLALLAVGLGAGLLQAGLSEHADADRAADLRSGGSGESDFSWRSGPWFAYAGGLLLLVAGVAGFLPARSRDDLVPEPPRPGPLPVGRLPLREEVPDEEEPETVPASRPDLAGRGPRRLVCPRCQHRFVGAWGVTPRCPQCGFSRNGAGGGTGGAGGAGPAGPAGPAGGAGGATGPA